MVNSALDIQTTSTAIKCLYLVHSHACIDVCIVSFKSAEAPHDMDQELPTIGATRSADDQRALETLGMGVRRSG